MGQATTLDTLLAFTDKGQYLFIPVYDLPDTKWKEEGKHINALITLPSEDHLIGAVLVSSFAVDARLILLTKNGQIKKTRLSDFMVARNSKPITCIRLANEDALVSVAVSNGRSDLLLFTAKGRASRYAEHELSTIGLKASGVKAVASLGENDGLVSLVCLDAEERQKIMLLTQEGHVRLMDSDYVSPTRRLAKMAYVFQSFKSEPHSLLAVSIIDKQRETWGLDALTSDGDIFHFESGDFAPTPVDKYAKKNLALKKQQSLLSLYQPFLMTIPADYPTYQPVETEPEPSEEVTQLSIFEDMPNE